MAELSLQELYKNPIVQELVEQNELMAEAMPQHLSEDKIKNLGIKPKVFLFKDRLLFQEGVHNGLFYKYDTMKENMSQWNNLDIFLAEHNDGSPAWVGLSKNPYLVPDEKAIYGTLEIVDENLANKLSYQIKNKNGRMGLSPTLDVDKQMLNGHAIAGGPWHLQSQSIVLNPAVRTTVFNSKQNGGENNMEPETQQLKKDEVAISKDELAQLKADRARLSDYEKATLAEEVSRMSETEVSLGLFSEDETSSRKEILGKMTSSERKVLSDSYARLQKILSEDSEEELFLNSLPENLKGAIPSGLKKYIEEQKKKKGAEQENADMPPADKRKKYPYPETQPQMNKEMLSEKRERLVEPKKVNGRFQELSKEKIEGNNEFINFLNKHQGTARRAQ